MAILNASKSLWHVRSAIFYHDDSQKEAANAVRDELQGTKIKNKIVTEIVPFENWWDAEEYHQKYLVSNPGGLQCFF